MHSLLLFIAALAPTALSAPTQVSARSLDLVESYSAVRGEINLAPRREKDFGAQQCDLSKAVLPSSSLPPPDAGQKLLHVVIGRGTQNYTCDSPSSDVKPKQVGAVATLYDASCIAANHPYLLSLLPNVALTLSDSPCAAEPFGVSKRAIIGHHYFSNPTTPVFDLNTPHRQFGVSIMTKADAVDAPATALKGVGTQMNGAVPWVRLIATPESKGDTKTIYRVNTAGGKPPATCAGVSGAFTVEYATEYWFYD